MPQAAQERAKNARVVGPNGTAATKVTDIPLYLPSALSKSVHVDKELQTYEWKLREGQAYDSLEEIRHVLRLRAHMYKNKDQNSRGVKANTRSNIAIANATTRINRAAGKYRAARTALVNLAPTLAHEQPLWEHALRKLEADDIRALSEGLFSDTEGTRTPSWIWMSYSIVQEGDGDTALTEGWWPEIFS